MSHITHAPLDWPTVELQDAGAWKCKPPPENWVDQTQRNQDVALTMSATVGSPGNSKPVRKAQMFPGAISGKSGLGSPMPERYASLCRQPIEKTSMCLSSSALTASRQLKRTMAASPRTRARALSGPAALVRNCPECGQAALCHPLLSTQSPHSL